jgi:SAM-dependent methyltransferase
LTNTLPSRLNNLWWERRLGISTRGVVPVDHPDAVHYGTMGYRTLRTVIRYLDLRESDEFVDVGSGKGRVLCWAARYPVRQVTGVDVSAPLCEVARANAARLRGRRAPISVHRISAADFDYSSTTVLYMFDPFGPDTLEAVLAKIVKDTADHEVRICYANPTHRTVFDRQPELEQTAFWRSEDAGLEHSVAFYRTAYRTA